MTLNGTEKSALLLMSIGPDRASEILKHLTPFEIQKLTIEMVNMNQFSAETVTKVLRECFNDAKDISTVTCNTNEYLSMMLTKAMGEKKGIDLLQEVLESRDINMHLNALNFIDPDKVANLLSKEHPQIITSILVHLEKNQSAHILSFFDHEKRSDIILRIANFSGIEENSILELKKVINHLLEYKTLVLSKKGSIKFAASILNTIPKEYEKHTIENMYKNDKKLASQIIKERFLFVNIIDFSDHYIQSIIKNIDIEKLCIALYNTHMVIREKFYKNMPEKTVHQLQMNLEKKWYFSNVAIKNEQELILWILKDILKSENQSIYKSGTTYV